MRSGNVDITRNFKLFVTARFATASLALKYISLDLFLI